MLVAPATAPSVKAMLPGFVVLAVSMYTGKAEEPNQVFLPDGKSCTNCSEM